MKRTIKNKTIWKRIVSGIITLCLVATMFPVTAFAADISSSYAPTYRALNPDGSYGDILSGVELEIDEGGELNRTADGSKIDLWVTPKEGEYQIPHVQDNAGNTWYLQNISLINDYLDPTATQVVMDAKAIKAANSMDAYVLDPADVTIDMWADTAYLVCYGWTSIPPDQWGEDPSDTETYIVKYDLNIPNAVDSISIIDKDGIPPQEGKGYNRVPEAVAELNGTTIKEGLNFTVADSLDEKLNADDLKGFLAYNVNDSDATSYYFGGWKDKTDKIHACDDIVVATEELAGDDKIIQLTAVWNTISPYSETELANIEQEVPLNVLTNGVNGNLLIAQSMDVLDKDNTISYAVSAGVNGDLLAKDDGVAFKGSDFATFEIIVNIDPNLEFANLNGDGTVTLNMASNLIIPKNIEMTGTDEAVGWTGTDGNWSVTFDPDLLPLDANGMQIVINAAFTDQNYKNFADKMTLTGLDFKLKDSAVGTVSQVNTSANMTANMNLKKIAGPGEIFNARFRFFVLRNLLMNNDAWSNYFGGGVDNPTAYVHALQFLDYKLADYDLSDDKLATLQANTATATVVQSEPIEIKPADMTIYEGGAGYEGVVDEDGKEIVSSGFPEPLFKIAMPEGDETAPTVLTFTNTTSGNSWKVEKAGTDSQGTTYYRLVNATESGKPIRVQFFGDNNQVIESDTVTTTEEVYDTHTIAIFSNENDVVTASAGETTYNVSAGTGNLTVRAVQENDATSDVISSEDEGSVGSFNEDGVYTGEIQSGNAVAVAPAGTTYTLNNTGVELPEDAIPSLLFDSIIEDGNSTTRTDALKEQASEWLDDNGLATGGTRHYEAKYLDLVDANNGNAWISSSAGTDIYWGYPEGTDKNTNFTLLHFNGLHRDGENSGYYEEDIAAAKLEQVEIENLDNGIKFHVGSGGFSPFVLVWTEASAPGPDPTPDPDPEPTPDPDEPGIADPDDTGVADWLNTEDHEVFLNGYPDGNFGPDRSMTRAEVAAMFSNLLLDKNVPITTSFSDVAEDAWYADAVNMLASLDMIVGYEDGTFRPDAPITRAEFTAIAMRFADAVPEGENIFSDVHAGDWFYDVVVGSIQYGWIGGYEDGTFRPQNTITRAEVTAITNRMLGRVADEAFIDAADALRSFGDLSDAHWAYYSIMEATNAHDYTISDGVEEWEALH